MTLPLKPLSLASRSYRLSFGSGPRESRSPIFIELGCLSLQNRRDFHKRNMVFKCQNGIASEYLAELFPSNDTVYMYNTHNASQLRATRTRTAYYNCRFTVLVQTY